MPYRPTSTPSGGRYSLWLLPDTEHEARLVETVARLSALLGGASFTPHVTIQGDIALALEQLHAPVRRMAGRVEPLRWTVRQVECSDHFYRCLYLRFDRLPEFTSMQRAAQRSTGTRAGLSPFPHLSLAYGEPHPDNAAMSQLLAQEFVSQDVVFDRIAIYRSSQSVPIQDWECLAQYPLSGPRR